MSNILLDNLSFGYGKNTLLKGISAQLQAGAVHYLTGPNGAGKSTLLKLLCGALVPDSGSIHINGKLLKEYSHLERARTIGTLWQNIDLNLDFTVRELVEILASARFPRLGKLADDDRAVIDNALEMFKLSDMQKQIVNTLSGGEKARTMLAGIFALSPDIMLLDEPAAALDPVWCNQTAGYLTEYAKKHLVLVITHDFELIGRAAGNLWLLGNNGEFFHGQAGDLLNCHLLSRIYGINVQVEELSEQNKRISFYQANQR